MKSYFKGDTTHMHVQFFRYGFVAVAAFAVDFGTFATLNQLLHIQYLIATAAGFILGLLVNYSLSVIWVFSAYSVASRKREFGIFATTGLIGLGLTELLMWIIAGKLHVVPLASRIVTASIVVLWNFASRKYLLYR